jgi:hypothetical protein
MHETPTLSFQLRKRLKYASTMIGHPGRYGEIHVLVYVMDVAVSDNISRIVSSRDSGLKRHGA